MSDTQRETGLALDVKYNEQGLVPAIVQDSQTRQILMMGWMNEAALRKTLETRKATFYSRSRNKMWVKGEESGNAQLVKELRVDCDQDVLLLKVENVGGAACHNGYKSCFYRKLVEAAKTDDAASLQLEFAARRVFDPATVYKSKK